MRIDQIPGLEGVLAVPQVLADGVNTLRDRARGSPKDDPLNRAADVLEALVPGVTRELDRARLILSGDDAPGGDGRRVDGASATDDGDLRNIHIGHA